jgi:hypothetical protein
MLNVTKSADGRVHIELRGDEGLELKADVRVDPHPEGVEIEFTFGEDDRLSALVPRPSAELLRDALSAALLDETAIELPAPGDRVVVDVGDVGPLELEDGDAQ